MAWISAVAQYWAANWTYEELYGTARGFPGDLRPPQEQPSAQRPMSSGPAVPVAPVHAEDRPVVPVSEGPTTSGKQQLGNAFRASTPSQSVDNAATPEAGAEFRKRQKTAEGSVAKPEATAPINLPRRTELTHGAQGVTQGTSVAQPLRSDTSVQNDDQTSSSRQRVNVR